MTRSPLGVLGPEQFLRTYWQRKPLLARAAMPDITGMFATSELIALACRDDVESRLVMRTSGRWQVRTGPFRRRVLTSLPKRGWTLLVQGVDAHLSAARALMPRFGFIPYARQDDLMVSLAPVGGGVGPHFDSYDVFLLQAQGRRRWRLSTQSDLRLVDSAPLKILRRFVPTREISVEPGDLLYLPPRYAHDGVAESDCITCSIGFRAPSRQEICYEFLQWLQDEIHLEGRYADRDLATQRHPAQISSAMIERVESMIGALQWRRSDVARFLGQYLTEPKPQMWFTRPSQPLSLARFTQQVRRSGIKLALKTRMLFDNRSIFINGERVDAPAHARPILMALADTRELMPWPCKADALSRMLHLWYKCGYVDLG
jgi:50S ribosomal protein L16 3-hydroxylase